MYCRNRTSCENFKLKICTYAQSIALSTRTQYQLKILKSNVISCLAYFRDIILESPRNVSETIPLTFSSFLCCYGIYIYLYIHLITYILNQKSYALYRVNFRGNIFLAWINDIEISRRCVVSSNSHTLKFHRYFSMHRWDFTLSFHVEYIFCNNETRLWVRMRTLSTNFNKVCNLRRYVCKKW